MNDKKWMISQYITLLVSPLASEFVNQLSLETYIVQLLSRTFLSFRLNHHCPLLDR